MGEAENEELDESSSGILTPPMSDDEQEMQNVLPKVPLTLEKKDLRNRLQDCGNISNLNLERIASETV